MKIGLFFGSFNPIHTGHLIIANIVKESTDCQEIWFVVSPQNPFKKNQNLLHEYDRLDLVTAAIEDQYQFRASDIEFNMPKPSYTIDTLIYLKEKHPNKEFKLIIGGDNLRSFHKWKNYEKILDYFGLIIYPRENTDEETKLVTTYKNIEEIEAPLLQISANLIRKFIREGKSVRYLVPDIVEERIRINKFYS